MAISMVILLAATFGGFLVIIHGFARMKEDTTGILDHYESMLTEARDALQDDPEDGAVAEPEPPPDAQHPR